MADITYKELSEAIAVQSLKDPAFRTELLADPAGTFKKYSGGQAPTGKVFVHENTANELHFVLPPMISKDELSDEDLEKVSGGEFFIGVAIIGLVGVCIGTGATIANDQTRARAGW